FQHAQQYVSLATQRLCLPTFDLMIKTGMWRVPANIKTKGKHMSSAVSLCQVVKHYRRGKESVEVLHELNLEIPEGEFVSLMGPSGSGKTTILNLVGGLDHADSGDVIVAGENLQKLSGAGLSRWRARHIGFVFQFYNLMPMLSASANVELPLLLTRLS